MAKFKLVLLLLVVLSMLTMPLYCSISDDTTDSDTTRGDGTPKDNNESLDFIKFDNPEAAYHILTKLDIFETSKPKELVRGIFNASYFGLKVNKNYCNEHRKYFVNNPKNIFQNKNFFSDYWSNRLREVTIPEIGRDMHPTLGFSSKGVPESSQDLSVEITAFYTNRKMSFFREVGIQFSCLTQTSNKIPKNLDLIKKDDFTFALRQYRREYWSRPQCLGKDDYFPKSWVLSDKNQCERFFKVFNKINYFKLKKLRKVIFMRKIAGFVHMGEGVFPVDQKEENYLRRLYANGAKCGKVQHEFVMQYMIPNPLLLEGRKFDFRVFLFIASTNPTIAYYYDGNLKVSLHEYDTNSIEPGVFITNIALSKAFFQEAERNGTYKGLTSEQLRSKVHWTYDDFFNYLWSIGKITDPDWIENHLRKEMKKLLVHVTKMTQKNFSKKSSVSEMYGVDLIIDEDLKLWFIEANQKPMIQGWTPEIVPYFDKLLKDGFEVTFGLLKSRIKRIIRYVNDITSEPDSWVLTKNSIILDNLKERRKEFKQLTMNRFESEFLPSPQNGFQLIVDENISGEGRYFGLSEECF